MADPLWGSVVSGFHFDGANGSTAFTDVKGISWNRSGSPVISTAWSQFGGSSAFFNWTTGDFLYTAYDPVFNLSTTNFCIDGWLNVTSANNDNLSYYGTVISKINSDEGDVDWVVRCNNTDLSFEWGDDESPKKEIKVPRPANGTGFHFEVDRVGNSLYMFINGILLGTGTIVGSIRNRDVQPRIGISSGALYVRYHGYMDDLRLTRAARHTANFSVPTAAFAETAYDPNERSVDFSGQYALSGQMDAAVALPEISAAFSGQYALGGSHVATFTVPGGADVIGSGQYVLGGQMLATATPPSVSTVYSGDYLLSGLSEISIGDVGDSRWANFAGRYSMRGALRADVWKPIRDTSAIVTTAAYKLGGKLTSNTGTKAVLSGEYSLKAPSRINVPYVNSAAQLAYRSRTTGRVE